MELCATIPGEPIPTGQFSDLIDPKKSSADKNSVSVTVQANVQLIRELTRLPQGTVAVVGNVRLGEWARLCYNLDEKEETSVNISFVVPENLTQTKAPQVCVILTGSSNILPLSRPSSICLPPVIEAGSTSFGIITGRAEQTIFNTIARNKNQCDNGSLLQLTYNSTTDYVIHLSSFERKRITWNLQVVSGFLLIVSILYVASRLIISRRSIVVHDGYQPPQLT